MKTFTTRTKTAALATSLVALTGAALASAAIHREGASPDVAKVEAQVVRLGDVPGFWSYSCPLADTDAASWAAGDGPEAAVLTREGFTLGVREPLRSQSGATGASVALEFRTAAGATADLERRERDARHAGDARTFAVPGLLAARGDTVRIGGLTIVRVAYTRGSVEYAVEARASGRVDVTRLQRLLAATAARAAGQGTN
ncbi:MAG TPA: hypothetical protein VFB17_03540 [Gaiellaceae bacterium]|nr:hypothetical protein [Gaiellaceae bacterium]